MSRVIEQAQPATRLTPRRVGRFLWETIWAPFWVGSTLPPPVLPGRREPHHADSERTPVLLRQIDALRETIWRQRRAVLLFRALWLALIPAAIWLGLRYFAGRQLAWQPLAIGMLAILVLGFMLAALARPSRGQLARTLDRSFGLRERVATALEESQGGRLVGVRALQVLEATRVAHDVSTASAFRRRLPVREVALAIIAATVCIVFVVLLGFRQLNPPATPPQQQAAPNQPGLNNPAPGQQPGNNPQAGQQGQTGQQGQQGGQTPGQNGQPSAQGQRDMDTLAGALDEHAATREVADKLANGDYPGAAQALREAGNQAGQLSPETREALANDLKNAAGQTGDPQLAQDLNELADQLTGPNPSQAQGAFDQVANDIERIGAGEGQGQQPGQNGQPGESGQQGQQGGQNPGGGSGSGSGASPQLPNSQQSQPPSLGESAPLLGADGKPIELPKGNQNGPQINTQNPNNSGNGQADPGAAGAGGGQLRQGTVGESGVDPNQVPYDQRGPVERYFTPPAEDER